MLERNNDFNEDLIDKFLLMNTAVHERSYGLIFHQEDSKRHVWQMIETVNEEELNENINYDIIPEERPLVSLVNFENTNYLRNNPPKEKQRISPLYLDEMN
ncbi:unnamed protein product [Rotaria sp. Silwood2]|nr:unnamed protein product [Rotaria sp. Silwood2]CAF3023214.1 unnamed protein product [Rotaria sp. Silwood2]CAF3201842.1 unnamed protein product [Rotaria sp. Silwood2]CAF4587214.1 unnamed protein product [Rotaria sp. Silwood2]